jgi:hypothetical protein
MAYVACSYANNLFATKPDAQSYTNSQLMSSLRLFFSYPCYGGMPKGPAKNKFPFLGRRDARLARREAFIISRYMTDEQRSQTGWIGVPKWEVILGWALSLRLS